MGGFRPELKTFRVTFEEGHELHGLEVRTRSVPVRTVMTVLRAGGAGIGGKTPGAEDVQAIDDLFENFGAALIEWNLEHPETGEPVPATPEGCRSLDLDLLTQISMHWVDAVLGAAAPLGQSSRPGEPEPSRFPVASLPMIPISEPIVSGGRRIS